MIVWVLERDHALDVALRAHLECLGHSAEYAYPLLVGATDSGRPPPDLLVADVSTFRGFLLDRREEVREELLVWLSSVPMILIEGGKAEEIGLPARGLRVLTTLVKPFPFARFEAAIAAAHAARTQPAQCVDDSTPPDERRRSPRHPFAASISLGLSNGRHVGPLEGELFDLSEGGAGLRTGQLPSDEEFEGLHMVEVEVLSGRLAHTRLAGRLAHLSRADVLATLGIEFARGLVDQLPRVRDILSSDLS